MEKTINNSDNKSSAYPGRYRFTGTQKVEKIKVSVINYNNKIFSEKEINDPQELLNCKAANCVSWINICGIHDPELINKIGEVFDLHPLVREDILDVNHTPKMEEYGGYIFVIAKMIDLTPAKLLNIEQVSFILGENYLITFQEDEQDIFDKLREQIRNGGPLRQYRSDYLMYRLLDAIVDNYFIVSENFDQRIELLEDRIISNYRRVSIRMIYKLKKEIIKFRRDVTPLREVIFSLEKEKDKRIEKSTYFFLRDLYDHLNHIVESIENERDNMKGMLDIYHSSASHKMNEVMKLLTIISTIFIPLTFIVGIYGMNFNTSVSWWNMPELNWKYGYVVIMVVMFAIAGGLLIIFKKKKWF